VLEKAKTAGAFAATDLGLSRLAAKLGLHPNEPSFIVNDRHGMGFREYLNTSRLGAFMELRKVGSSRILLEDCSGRRFLIHGELSPRLPRTARHPSENLNRNADTGGGAGPNNIDRYPMTM
jgi:hypothetical protein